MTGFLTSNLGWKLGSLGAAVILWVLVASEPELATMHSVPVEYKGVPNELEISSVSIETVVLELRGPSGRLRDLRDSRPAVVMDFSSVHQAGERTFSVDSSNVSLPRGIQLVRSVPAQLQFRFEHRVTREVSVEAQFSAPHEGYTLASYEVIPAKLTVAGPQTAVERTNSVKTDPVVISSVISSRQFRVNTYLAERQVRFQSPSHVIVSVVVKKK